jgi:hypothetical protein
MLALDAEPVGDASSDSSRLESTGRRGRPRKWDSDADRKRAYRQRLAADLEQPRRLREELRNERRRASALRDEANRQHRRADAAERLLAAVRVERDAAEQRGRDAHESMAAVWTSLNETRKELVEERAARVRATGDARVRESRDARDL